MKRTLLLLTALASAHAQEPTRDQALAAMRKAATFFSTKAAVQGGYVYYYSPDFSRRLGEGKASQTQVWVQPPGTPAVGLAYLKAYEATDEKLYLDAAREAAEALVYGQLASGGWMNSIDFGPPGKDTGKYRNGKGGKWDFSSLDDGITQTALRFLMHADRALKFQHRDIHAASESGRKALLAAQFEHGAFPQGWSKPVSGAKAVKASFPDYDWKTENRIKEYWHLPTLNDDVCGYVTQALLDAWEIYKDERCRAAVVKLGDFLLLAQLPEPQPGWAQQYDLQMRPVWARKFEPPAVSGRESQDAIETLILIYRLTGDAKYLAPHSSALAWLKRSLLPDGRLARYYELKTNKPLYMTDDYQITHDDAKVPQHYGWKTKSYIDVIERSLAAAKAGAPAPLPPVEDPAPPAAQIIRDLDREGRWLTTAGSGGEMLVGQPKFKPGEQYLSSAVFARNLEALAATVARRDSERVRNGGTRAPSAL